MSYSSYPMPTPCPTPDPSNRRSPSPYHYDGYPSQMPSNQVTYYNNHQLQSSQSISTINSYNAQQIAHSSQMVGADVALYVDGKPVNITIASINAFCNEFVCSELAESPRLTAKSLNDLERNRKISIHHREELNGDILRNQFATQVPRVIISCSVAAAVGDFSQFKDIIDKFFKYEFSDTITSHSTYSTHYYANDQHTVTGCFLSRTINKKDKGIRASLMRASSTKIKYETHCYLFTFKVAQATKFIKKYLSG